MADDKRPVFVSPGKDVPVSKSRKPEAKENGKEKV